VRVINTSPLVAVVLACVVLFVPVRRPITDQASAAGICTNTTISQGNHRSAFHDIIKAFFEMPIDLKVTTYNFHYEVNTRAPLF